MSGINGGAAVDKAVFEAYVREGYVKADGTRDAQKMREHIFDAISKQKVLGKGERAAKAVKRGDLVATVFPNLPGPDTYDENDALARDVYKQVAADVWNETRPAADGRVQRMVGMNMGNGYVLCRTKVGTDRIDAAYITDVIECIRLDFTRPDNEALNRRIASSTRNREMLVIRQPNNAKAYAGEYDRTLKAALSTAHDQVQLTLESVTANLVDEDEDE